jgi:hypothetical protein
MPKVDLFGQRITKTQKNIQFACDCIDRADEQVRGKVNSLSDVFGAIF